MSIQQSNLRRGTVLITGASSGFGAATAKLIAKNWPYAKLMLIGRRRDRLEAVAKEIALGNDGRAEVFPLDLQSRRAVELFAKDNSEKLKNVSVLINSAGLAAGLDTFQESNMDDWDQMIDTNVKGLLYMSRSVVPHMIAKGEGHVVNIGSIAGHRVYPKGHVYNATKFAVRALTEAMRMDFLGTGIRVTSIDPGMAETEFSTVRFKGDAAKARNVYEGMHPLSADDIAEAILWSLDRPAHVNVQEILLMPTDQAGPRDVSRKGAK